MYKNRGLLELAQTPILLSLLCINYDETLTFPSRRNEIYQEAIDALLKKWDSSRNIRRDEIYKGLSPLRRRQLLSRVAIEYFEQGEILFSTKDIANRIELFLKTLPELSSEIIDGTVVLTSIEAQHGLIVERARGIHSFSHLSLQEYLTSDYIIDSLDKLLRHLMQYITDSRWHEIFIMVAGALSHADDFFELFLSNFIILKQNMNSLKNYNSNIETLQDLSSCQRFSLLYVSSKYNLRAHTRFLIKSVLDSIHELPSLEQNSNKKDISSLRSNCLNLSRILGQIDITNKTYKLFNLVPHSLLEDIRVLLDRNRSIQENIDRADQIYESIYKAQSIFDEINSRRFIETDVGIQVEANTILENLKLIEKQCSEALDNFEKLDNQLNTSVSNDKWYSVLLEVSPEQFSLLLYSEKLLLECLSIAAVSDRENILEKSFSI